MGGSQATTATPAHPVPGPVFMDPRIRRRRIEVRRAEGRRRLRLLLGAATTVVVVAGAWGTTRSPLLDVDRVRLSGLVHTDEASAWRAAGIEPGRAMTDVDEEAAARRLEALPWIASARVRRRWPGAVDVTVRERQPVASVPAVAGPPVLVDASGRVLGPRDARVSPLPELQGAAPVGPPGTRAGADVERLLQVAAALPEQLGPDVASVVAGADGSVVLHLRRERVAVVLGPPDELATKLATVAAMLKAVDVRGAVALDVSVPTRPVLTRSPPRAKVSTLSGG
jgi:cell division protein FtsQ